MAFCTKCGKQLAAGIKFCTSCGAAVTGQAATPQTDSAVPVPKETAVQAVALVDDGKKMQIEADTSPDSVEEVEADPYLTQKQQARKVFFRNIVMSGVFLILAIVLCVISSRYPVTTIVSYSTSEEVNLRDAPGTNSSIIKTLSAHIPVTVLDDTQDWFSVEVDDNGNMLSGFVNSRYLTSKTDYDFQISKTISGKILMVLLAMLIAALAVLFLYFRSICPHCKMKHWREEVGTEYLGKTVERSTRTEYDRVETISTRTGEAISYQNIPRHTRVKKTYKSYRTYYQCIFCGHEHTVVSKHLVDTEES